MITTREIHLPQGATFYEREFEYDVSVDPHACANFTLTKSGQPVLNNNNPVTFTYAIDPILADIVGPLRQGKTFKTTLERVLDASIRYYRTGKPPQFSMPELLDQRFLLARDFGYAFRHTPGGSLAHQSLQDRKLHRERAADPTELFGYGLAIDFARQLFDLPPERFFFVTGSNARADFRSHLSFENLTDQGANVALVQRSGHVFNLEVKALSGWASFRSDSEAGVELLYNIHKKATSSARGVFLATITKLPSVSNTQAPTGRCEICLADPGAPVQMSENEQLVVILNETLAETLRVGLWPTAWWILTWLQQLGDFGPAHARQIQELVAFSNMNQYRTESRLVNGVRYWGRTFSEALYLLGTRGSRGLTRDDATSRLARRDFGWFWFSGLHEDIIEAVRTKDSGVLLDFHLGLSQKQQPLGAVYLQYLESDDALQNAVSAEFARALRGRNW